MIFIVCNKLFKEKAFIGVGTIKYGWMLQLSFSELDSWFHTDSDNTAYSKKVRHIVCPIQAQPDVCEHVHSLLQNFFLC